MMTLSGVVLPVVVVIFKRHYAANPNAWEEILVLGGCGLFGCVAGFWLISLAPFDDGSLGRLAVVVVAGWSLLFGSGLLLVVGAQARDTLRQAREK